MEVVSFGANNPRIGPKTSRGKRGQPWKQLAQQRVAKRNHEQSTRHGNKESNFLCIFNENLLIDGLLDRLRQSRARANDKTISPIRIIANTRSLLSPKTYASEATCTSVISNLS